MQLINTHSSEDVAKKLACVLADSYTLYLMTQRFHWNVTGPLFQSLHALFEEQYTELSAAVDVLAERIRALGYFAPGFYEEFDQLTKVQTTVDNPEAREMVRRLVNAHNTLVDSLNELLKTADDAGDEPTVDLAIERLEIHQDAAWMLRSIVEDHPDYPEKSKTLKFD